MIETSYYNNNNNLVKTSETNKDSNNNNNNNNNTTTTTTTTTTTINNNTNSTSNCNNNETEEEEEEEEYIYQTTLSGKTTPIITSVKPSSIISSPIKTTTTPTTAPLIASDSTDSIHEIKLTTTTTTATTTIHKYYEPPPPIQNTPTITTSNNNDNSSSTILLPINIITNTTSNNKPPSYQYAKNVPVGLSFTMRHAEQPYLDNDFNYMESTTPPTPTQSHIKCDKCNKVTRSFEHTITCSNPDCAKLFHKRCVIYPSLTNENADKWRCSNCSERGWSVSNGGHRSSSIPIRTDSYTYKYDSSIHPSSNVSSSLKLPNNNNSSNNNITGLQAFNQYKFTDGRTHICKNPHLHYTQSHNSRSFHSTIDGLNKENYRNNLYLKENASSTGVLNVNQNNNNDTRPNSYHNKRLLSDNTEVNTNNKPKKFNSFSSYDAYMPKYNFQKATTTTTNDTLHENNNKNDNQNENVISRNLMNIITNKLNNNEDENKELKMAKVLDISNDLINLSNSYCEEFDNQADSTTPTKHHHHHQQQQQQSINKNNNKLDPIANDNDNKIYVKLNVKQIYDDDDNTNDNNNNNNNNKNNNKNNPNTYYYNYSFPKVQSLNSKESNNTPTNNNNNNNNNTYEFYLNTNNLDSNSNKLNYYSDHTKKIFNKATNESGGTTDRKKYSMEVIPNYDYMATNETSREDRIAKNLNKFNEVNNQNYDSNRPQFSTLEENLAYNDGFRRAINGNDNNWILKNTNEKNNNNNNSSSTKPSHSAPTSAKTNYVTTHFHEEINESDYFNTIPKIINNKKQQSPSKIPLKIEEKPTKNSTNINNSESSTPTKVLDGQKHLTLNYFYFEQQQQHTDNTQQQQQNPLINNNNHKNENVNDTANKINNNNNNAMNINYANEINDDKKNKSNFAYDTLIQTKLNNNNKDYYLKPINNKNTFNNNNLSELDEQQSNNKSTDNETNQLITEIESEIQQHTSYIDDEVTLLDSESEMRTLTNKDAFKNRSQHSPVVSISPVPVPPPPPSNVFNQKVPHPHPEIVMDTIRVRDMEKTIKEQLRMLKQQESKIEELTTCIKKMERQLESSSINNAVTPLVQAKHDSSHEYDEKQNQRLQQEDALLVARNESVKEGNDWRTSLLDELAKVISKYPAPFIETGKPYLNEDSNNQNENNIEPQTTNGSIHNQLVNIINESFNKSPQKSPTKTDANQATGIAVNNDIYENIPDTHNSPSKSSTNSTIANLLIQPKLPPREETMLEDRGKHDSPKDKTESPKKPSNDTIVKLVIQPKLPAKEDLKSDEDQPKVDTKDDTKSPKYNQSTTIDNLVLHPKLPSREDSDNEEVAGKGQSRRDSSDEQKSPAKPSFPTIEKLLMHPKLSSKEDLRTDETTENQPKNENKNDSTIEKLFIHPKTGVDTTNDTSENEDENNSKDDNYQQHQSPNHLINLLKQFQGANISDINEEDENVDDDEEPKSHNDYENDPHPATKHHLHPKRQVISRSEINLRRPDTDSYRIQHEDDDDDDDFRRGSTDAVNNNERFNNNNRSASLERSSSAFATSNYHADTLDGRRKKDQIYENTRPLSVNSIQKASQKGYLDRKRFDKLFRPTERWYCVLDGSQLHLYKSHKDKKQTKTVSLTGCSIRTAQDARREVEAAIAAANTATASSGTSKKKPNLNNIRQLKNPRSFEIIWKQGKIYQFIASNDDEYNHWVNALKTAASINFQINDPANVYKDFCEKHSNSKDEGKKADEEN